MTQNSDVSLTTICKVSDLLLLWVLSLTLADMFLPHWEVVGFFLRTFLDTLEPDKSWTVDTSEEAKAVNWIDPFGRSFAD